MNRKRLMSLIGAALALVISAGPAFSEGDAESGEKVFNRCKTCHILEGDAKRIGPSLECVFGRTAGTLEGFRYSPAMAESGVVWSAETISEYLRDPKAYIPKNKMTLPGIKNEQQIEDLVAFLVDATKTANCQ